MFSKPVSQPLSRRFQLRHSTAAEHEALDAMVGGFDSRDSYRSYVRSIHAFRLPIERALVDAGWSSAFDAWTPLSIRDALTRDVDVLDIARAEQLPSPKIETRDALYGYLYTLEGSSLGAQLLVKRAALLGFGEENGASHLVLQAGAIGSWRSYCAVLEAAPDLDMDRVSEAACEAFSRARQSFERADA